MQDKEFEKQSDQQQDNEQDRFSTKLFCVNCHATEEPLKCNKCDLQFCKSCILSWCEQLSTRRNHGRCAMSFPSPPDVFEVKELHHFICPNKSQGCDSEIPWSQTSSHLVKCDAKFKDS